MADERRTFKDTLLMLFICLLPFVVVFVLMLNKFTIGPIWFWLALGLCVAVMLYYMRGTQINDQPMEHDVVIDDAAMAAAQQLLAAAAVDIVPKRKFTENGKLVLAEGEGIKNPGETYRALKRKFVDTGFIPLLQERDDGSPLLLLLSMSRNAYIQRTGFPWLNVVLLSLTLLTTTWAGAAHLGVNLLTEPLGFVVGLPYGLGIMLILGAHELGHYIAARVHKLDVTLPYFIPAPFALGTFGAFIQMKSPSEDRRSLFDVAVAGPLAGLVFAIPALFIGLQYSTVTSSAVTADLMHGGTDVGSSIFLALLAKLALGSAVVEGHQIILHPLAFAGWLGLLVTALNLLPIGQLDGGHVAHALFGRRKSDTIGMVVLFALFLLGIFVWSGLLMWAVIVFFIAGTKSAPPLDDVTPLDNRRVVLGAFSYILLFLILTPVPHAFYQTLSIHCPYV